MYVFNETTSSAVPYKKYLIKTEATVVWKPNKVLQPKRRGGVKNISAERGCRRVPAESTTMTRAWSDVTIFTLQWKTVLIFFTIIAAERTAEGRRLSF